MTLKGTPSVLHLSRTDIWLMCTGAVLWVLLCAYRYWTDSELNTVFMVSASLMVLVAAVLAQVECRVIVRSVVQKSAGALTLLAVGYSWLVTGQLVWEGLALPVVLTLLVPWHLVLMGIVTLALLLLITSMTLPAATVLWPYWGAYIVSCWLALFLAWRQRQLNDAHIEGKSADGSPGLYNFRRMAVELGREISRADRGNTGLVVVCFRWPENSEDMDVQRMGYGLSRVMPRHYSAFRINHKAVAVIMPIATIDDVVLLKADVSDVLGNQALSCLPLVYMPQSGVRDDISASGQRLDDMMMVVRKLSE